MSKLLLIFLLIAMQSGVELYGQNSHAKFKRINIEDGLSQNQIFCIYKDKLGLLWFGTQDGLNLYDGYKFKVFRHQPGNVNSLPDYAVNTICETDTGIFWIGTREGMSRFDLRTETFLHFRHNPDSSNSLVDNIVWQILPDEKGNLWIATRNGLSRYNPLKNKFSNFKHQKTGNISLSNNFVFSLARDSQNNIWIGGRGGLDKYDPVTNRIFNYKIDPENPDNIVANGIVSLHLQEKILWVGSYSGFYSVDTEQENISFRKHLSQESHLTVRSIFSGSDGTVWAGSIEDGLIRYNPSTVKQITYKASRNPESISEQYITSLLMDDDYVLWIGTYTTGINKYNISSEKIRTIEFNQSINDEYPEVSAVLEDKNKTLWIGTGSGRIFKVTDQFSSDYKIHQQIATQDLISYFGGVEVRSMIQAKDGTIWAGTFGDGIYLFRDDGTKSSHINFDPQNKNSIPNNFIHSIFESEDGHIWIGTGAGGLCEYNPEAKKFILYKNIPNDSTSLSSNEIAAICEDGYGSIWAGSTTGGLNRLNRQTGRFERFTHDVTNLNSLTSNRVICLYVDSKAQTWIGTFGGGLNLWKPETKSFTHFTTMHGLPSNIINSIVEDTDGNLWISTDKGISKFIVSENLFKNYDVNDGLQGNEFIQNAGYASKITGMLYFGGKNGLNIIDPKNLNTKTKPANIVLTDFRIFNKSIAPGVESELKENVYYTKEITLSHDQNFFTFEFASLDFSNPEKNLYAYKMEGFNRDWVQAGNQRFATYTNLDPGEYTFYVKATNSSGVWNEAGLSVKIILLPPWWQTWWAYLLYGVFFITILYSFRQYEMKRVRLRNELRLKDFEANKLQEVDQLKSHFFANISHEFRTPLTLILGLIQNFEQRLVNKNDINDLGVMKRNAYRLLQLINQLLELSKIEAGKSKLTASEKDIVSFVKRVFVSFASLAEQKKIKLSFNNSPINSASTDVINLFFDQDKMEKIISNLISNAVKYTPEGNEIEIKVTSLNNSALISVLNTGITISKADLSHLFERYYKVHKAEEGLFEGTGIGLALVKELVEMHKGTISVSSEYDITEFKLSFPMGRNHLSNNDISDEKIIENINEQFSSIEKSAINTNIEEVSDKLKTDRDVILVVEDHSDLRKYIKDNLSSSFKVIESIDGKDGLDKALEFIPDLIISDVMMPKMDGFQLCKKIKTNDKTNHIPLILLTAKAAMEDKLGGLELGADDYLIKPFNPEELRLRVKNLITTREQLRTKFTSEMILKPAEVIVPSSQVQFIERLKSIIEINMEDESFSVDKLASEIGMSRSQLHRKLKAVTNQSTTEFIRNFRLQRAAQFILQDAGSMAEIAYKVGFNSQAYFNKSFHELFGCSPSEYRSRQNEQHNNLS
ncbi:MAG: response regulator [Ignavibacteriales bacterium]|nr:MAG: response regulator [Ignavibacteriales bacterium]